MLFKIPISCYFQLICCARAINWKRRIDPLSLSPRLLSSLPLQTGWGNSSIPVNWCKIWAFCLIWILSHRCIHHWRAQEEIGRNELEWQIGGVWVWVEKKAGCQPVGLSRVGCTLSKVVAYLTWIGLRRIFNFLTWRLISCEETASETARMVEDSFTKSSSMWEANFAYKVIGRPTPASSAKLKL